MLERPGMESPDGFPMSMAPTVAPGLHLQSLHTPSELSNSPVRAHESSQLVESAELS